MLSFTLDNYETFKDDVKEDFNIRVVNVFPLSR